MPRGNRGWKPGVSGNPQGRPPGTPSSGRGKALKVLDDLFEKSAANLEVLRTTLQAAFDKAPLQFFREFVMPLAYRKGGEAEAASLGAPIRVILNADNVPQVDGLSDEDWGRSPEDLARQRKLQSLRREIGRLNNEVAREKGT